MSTSRQSTDRTLLARGSPHIPPTIAVVVQTNRNLDLTVAALPFEVFAKIRLELKQRGPIQPPT